jgi:mono/diheme cytochrome c family protein
MRQLRLVFAALSLVGCNDERGIDLERMVTQYVDRPYTENLLFEDCRSMRPPPPGTVHRQQAIAGDPLSTGLSGERYLDSVPLPVDRALLRRGQDRFGVFCAPCHGPRGDGRSEVAENMRLRPPPSFYQPPVSELPVGRIFRVATEGYGLMPRYSRQLSDSDRWAVVAYVDVLRLSRLGAASSGGQGGGAP